MGYSAAGLTAAVEGIADAGTWIQAHTADPGVSGTTSPTGTRVQTTWGTPAELTGGSSIGATSAGSNAWGTAHLSCKFQVTEDTVVTAVTFKRTSDTGTTPGAGALVGIASAQPSGTVAWLSNGAVPEVPMPADSCEVVLDDPVTLLAGVDYWYVNSGAALNSVYDNPSGLDGISFPEATVRYGATFASSYSEDPKRIIFTMAVEGESSVTVTGSEIALAIGGGVEVTHWSLWSASSGGTFLGGWALGAPEAFGSAGSLNPTPVLEAANAA